MAGATVGTSLDEVVTTEGVLNVFCDGAALGDDEAQADKMPTPHKITAAKKNDVKREAFITLSRRCNNCLRHRILLDRPADRPFRIGN